GFLLHLTPPSQPLPVVVDDATPPSQPTTAQEATDTSNGYADIESSDSFVGFRPCSDSLITYFTLDPLNTTYSRMQTSAFGYEKPCQMHMEYAFDGIGISLILTFNQQLFRVDVESERCASV
ncbi:hypothetical protein C5167_002906, partial [Papaver somniferum]